MPNRRPKPKAYSEDLLWHVMALMCAHAARAAAHAPKALLPRSWYYGYAQREAAELLCMHVNTVARVMQRFPAWSLASGGSASMATRSSTEAGGETAMARARRAEGAAR